MLKRKASFAIALLVVSLPALGQSYQGDHNQDRNGNNGYQNSRDSRDNRDSHDRDNRDNVNQNYRGSQNFYNGVRDGGRGGEYYDSRHADDGYDERYSQQQHRGGIGPGKGALIGGAGGAVLGAAIGRGLKGSLIGGAAGAGIGAVVGNAAQNRRRDSYDR